METETALVRSDGTVELYTETSVDLNFAFIVNPWYTEHNNTFWFNDSLK